MKLKGLLENDDDGFYAGSAEGLGEMTYKGKTFHDHINDAMERTDDLALWDRHEIELAREESVHKGEYGSEDEWDNDNLEYQNHGSGHQRAPSSSDYYLEYCVGAPAERAILDLGRGIIYFNAMSRANVLADTCGAKVCAYDIAMRSVQTMAGHSHIDVVVRKRIAHGKAVDITSCRLRED